MAVVTGAGSGLGLGTAARLGEAGADLFLHYRTPRPQMDVLIERLRKEEVIVGFAGLVGCRLH